MRASRSITLQLWIILAASTVCTALAILTPINGLPHPLTWARYYVREYSYIQSSATSAALIISYGIKLWRGRRFLLLAIPPFFMGILLYTLHFSLLVLDRLVVLPQVERRVGGVLHNPGMPDGRFRLGLCALDSIQPDGALAKAKAKNGLIVVPPWTIDDIMRKCTLPRGTVIKLPVVEGGTGPSLMDRPQHDLEIILP